MAGKHVVTDNRNLALPYPASLAVAVYDLVYWDKTNKVVKPLTSKATLASEVLDQIDAAQTFLGFSTDQRLATETSTGTDSVRVIGVEGVCDYDCPSQVIALGDFIGVTWAGGTALVNQQVTGVGSDMSRAIGVCIQNNAAAVTRVRFRLFSRFCWDIGQSARTPFGPKGTAATTLADGAATLTVASNPILNMVPTSPRNVTLPAEAQAGAGGVVFVFTNNSGGANNVTFLGSAGGTIKGNGVVPQNKTVLLWSDGTNWNGLLSA